MPSIPASAILRRRQDQRPARAVARAARQRRPGRDRGAEGADAARRPGKRFVVTGKARARIRRFIRTRSASNISVSAARSCRGPSARTARIHGEELRPSLPRVAHCQCRGRSGGGRARRDVFRRHREGRLSGVQGRAQDRSRRTAPMPAGSAEKASGVPFKAPGAPSDANALPIRGLQRRHAGALRANGGACRATASSAS